MNDRRQRVAPREGGANPRGSTRVDQCPHFGLAGGDRHPALASGSIPTYLAIPLKGGEHLPGSIPTFDTGSQPGQDHAGPLNFDSVVKANLDAMLSASRLAVVDASAGNYLV